MNPNARMHACMPHACMHTCAAARQPPRRRLSRHEPRGSSHCRSRPLLAVFKGLSFALADARSCASAVSVCLAVPRPLPAPPGWPGRPTASPAWPGAARCRACGGREAGGGSVCSCMWWALMALLLWRAANLLRPPPPSIHPLPSPSPPDLLPLPPFLPPASPLPATRSRVQQVRHCVVCRQQPRQRHVRRTQRLHHARAGVHAQTQPAGGAGQQQPPVAVAAEGRAGRELARDGADIGLR